MQTPDLLTDFKLADPIRFLRRALEPAAGRMMDMHVASAYLNRRLDLRLMRMSRSSATQYEYQTESVTALHVSHLKLISVFNCDIKPFVTRPPRAVTQILFHEMVSLYPENEKYTALFLSIQ